jgi:hypothetical protein
LRASAESGLNDCKNLWRFAMEPDILYTDFKNRTDRLRNIIVENVSKYPKPLDKLGLEYLRAKGIIPGTGIIKGLQPNSPFWLQNAFDIENKDKVADTLWTGLVYLGLSYTARDDLIDNDKDPNIDLLALSNLFMADFINLHETIFPKDSKFWYIFSNSIAECYKAEVWEGTSDIYTITEFSEDFLLMLTKKHTWISVPTLWTFPLLAGRDDLVDPLVNMLKYYYIAHKLLDDLDDWEIDLQDKNFNFSSTILFFILQDVNKIEQITCDEIRVSMITSNFIETILEIAVDYLFRSLSCIEKINTPYLKMFLEGRAKMLQERKQSIQMCRNQALSQFCLLNGLVSE